METMRCKGQTTTLEERVRIGERASSRKSSREIALELDRPLATIRKWRQSYARKAEMVYRAKWADLLLDPWQLLQQK
jgi:IS30 family transposase